MRLILAAALLAPAVAFAAPAPISTSPADILTPLGQALEIGCVHCETIVLTPPKGRGFPGLPIGAAINVPAPRGTIITVNGKTIR